MRKNIFTLFFLTLSFYTLSQNKTLPKGWGNVFLDGKPAYMNLVTGDIITTSPKKAALKSKEIIEYDSTQNHIVKKGETLSSIARKYNLSLTQMYKLNNVEDFDKIKVGQEIVIGNSRKSTKSTNTKSQDNTHTVVAGETLYRISKFYNLTVAKLKSLNGLNSNIVSVGQQLKVK